MPAELTDELKYDLSPISMVSAAANPGTPIAVIDFSPEEIGLAANNGFIPVTLGPNRLRTETAGIVACSTAFLCNEVMG